MLSYLNAEAGFIRAYGNRCLLLVFLCALTRSAEASKVSALGLSLDISPATIAVFGPPLALLLLIGLRMESDVLLMSRSAVLDELIVASRYRSRLGVMVYLLFVVPALAAAFLVSQFFLKLAATNIGCDGWHWWDHLIDFSHLGGTPSTYCIQDMTGGPWFYPPFQGYVYLAIVAYCFLLVWKISRAWPQLRGR
ncbi:hypothetical protein [Rhizobium sp. SG741]|uniref:hypothetical protein n=1 Tax=Rhizobium sp. SG741 TaxID=2587114 RepID=UPI0014457E57|nr:hypothetical protein [Rhizobium sp. SG741]NKJ09017.1 hypothetical protein [Rhizobium sp. SG741]